jgi:general secretion pathway protein F
VPVFEYKGLDGKGNAVADVIDADNAKVARSRLRRIGVFPTEVKEQSGKATRGSGLSMEIDVAAYLEFITTRDLSTLTNQMATLLGAAVPMGETLTALVEQTEKQKLKIVLSKIKERVNEGATLGDALADHPKVFNQLYISMVRAGERTGSLADLLKRLAGFTDAQVALQGKISSALAYPLLMAVVGTLMIGGLFVGVIPRVRGLFEGFGGEEALPTLTRVVFFCGDVLLGWGWIFPFLIFGVVWVFRRWVKTDKGRRKFDVFKLKMPGVGKLNRLIAVSRFCRTLGTLLLSGVPILSALSIVRDVVGNVVIADAVTAAANNIQEGQSISAPLKESGQFPPMVIHMIAIGEKTGELERMLTMVADAYDSQVEAAINAFMSLLGPLMIMLMGGVVFIVALGLLQPMIGLSSMMR